LGHEDLKIGFGESEDLIDNDPNSELSKRICTLDAALLELGSSEEEFQTFLSEVIPPRFPDGLTVYDTDGQFLDSMGTLIQEPSKVVPLTIFEDTLENEAEIDEIIEAYKQ